MQADYEHAVLLQYGSALPASKKIIDFHSRKGPLSLELVRRVLKPPHHLAIVPSPEAKRAAWISFFLSDRCAAVLEPFAYLVQTARDRPVCLLLLTPDGTALALHNHPERNPEKQLPYFLLPYPGGVATLETVASLFRRIGRTTRRTQATAALTPRGRRTDAPGLIGRLSRQQSRLDTFFKNPEFYQQLYVDGGRLLDMAHGQGPVKLSQGLVPTSIEAPLGVAPWPWFGALMFGPSRTREVPVRFSSELTLQSTSGG